MRKEFALNNPIAAWPAGATLGPIRGMASYAGGRYASYVDTVNTSAGEGYCTLLLEP